MGNCLSYYTRRVPSDQELGDRSQQDAVVAKSEPSKTATPKPAPVKPQPTTEKVTRPTALPNNLDIKPESSSSSNMTSNGTDGSSDPFTLALHQNKVWAQQTAQAHPTLFPTLATGQHPKILWLGCSDSRVPETTVLGLQPGEVFVHRNIANVLPPTDLSSQSVIMYAVLHLKVQHVVVCGHTSCGGVAAALSNSKLGIIDLWLNPIRKLRSQLASLPSWSTLDAKERALRLVEANVRQGVLTLRENPEVIEARKERGLIVHGVVYDVATGVLTELQIGDEEQERLVREDAFHTK